MQDYKLCTGHCGPPKPLSEFSQNKTHKDGFQNYCKQCLARARRLKYADIKRKRPKRWCPACHKMRTAGLFKTKRSKICRECADGKDKRFCPICKQLLDKRFAGHCECTGGKQNE